ncbi:hypothetical protein [Nocardia sp. NPDC127526]|uniref:hypothetical protein n=1 Tax=Nocardia sp. NPDC127526 TaxID=3345393 RepID=UPI00362A926C
MTRPEAAARPQPFRPRARSPDQAGAVDRPSTIMKASAATWTTDMTVTAITDPEELGLVTRFLDGGGLVMGTSRRSADLLDPARGRVIPTTTRTDGTWLWPTSVRYYLIEHAASIQTEFLEHIRSRDYVPAQPDTEQIRAALKFLGDVSLWASAPKICIVRTKSDTEWSAAFAIDGRDYDTHDEFHRAVLAAFDVLAVSDVIAEFETSPVGIAEPVQLPTWSEYRARRLANDLR